MKAIVTAHLLCASVVSFGQEEPMAPWTVHTVVTRGPTFYEGDKTRAILVYGETGNPRLTIERIHVEMGYPSASRVVWSTEVDFLGARQGFCPLAETYCARIEGLEWTEDALVYRVIRVIADSATLHCRIDVAETGPAPARCEPARD